MAEEIEWITINHVHIPIKPGQSKDDAVKEFTEQQEQKKALQDKSVEELKKHEKPSDRTGITQEIPQSLIDYCESLSDDEIVNNQGWLTAKQKEDKVLKNIIEISGYNELPTIVSEDKIHSLIDNGYIGFTRGMRVEFGAEQFRNGDMYIGRGVAGSGVYVTAFTKNGEFTDESDAIKNAKKYAGMFDTPYTGSILLGALSKETKIIPKDSLIELKEKILPKLPPKAQAVFGNLGRLAVALGYDCIDCGNRSYLVVLNRGKTIVAK